MFLKENKTFHLNTSHIIILLCNLCFITQNKGVAIMPLLLNACLQMPLYLAILRENKWWENARVCKHMFKGHPGWLIHSCLSLISLVIIFQRAS